MKDIQKELTLPNLPVPIKVLFTGFLMSIGLGLLMAGMQIMLTHGMADGEMGLSVDDVVYSYYGDRDGSKLEAKLNGSMADKASAEEKAEIIKWVRAGADTKTYETKIRLIVEAKCVMCHNEHTPMKDFTKLANLQEVAQTDKGVSVDALTRVSHIHLFGISFIFFMVGLIFSFAEGQRVLFKSFVIVTPFAFLIIDVLSWWLTKYWPGFAYMTIIGGVGYSLASCYMFVVSLYQMWFKRRY